MLANRTAFVASFAMFPSHPVCREMKMIELWIVHRRIVLYKRHAATGYANAAGCMSFW